MATFDSDVLVNKVFKFVSNRCFVTFADLRKNPSPLAAKRTPRDVANWIRNHLYNDKRFAVHEQNGKVISVKIASRVRMCFHYVKHGNHRRDRCNFWHVCKQYIEGNCQKTWCPEGLSHDFHDDENGSKTDQLGFAALSNDTVRRIVAFNLPQVCSAYVQDSCEDSNCPYLHLCADYVDGNCTNVLNCRKSHNPRSDHNDSVLRADGFGATVEDKFILCNALLPNQSILQGNTPRKPARRSGVLFNNGPRTQRADPGHVHEDGTVHICSDFILGQCKNGARCAKHHCALPYQWQYRSQEGGGRTWQSLPEVDNKKLEECYCTPSLNANFNLIQLQRPNPLGTMESGLAFSIEDMTLSSTNYCMHPADLRRLSTESFVANPGNALATTWTWYWQDETKAWKTFGSGVHQTAVQQDIEAAFLDQSTQWHEYNSPQHSYRLYFRQKPMYQRNMRTATTRLIQRRPVFRQKDEVQQLKSSQRQVPFQRPGSVKEPGLPSHWTQMPQGIDFKRVPLACTSEEFKKVEKRFRETLPQNKTTLIKIERVQNPYMWEKFNRKKEKMKTKSRGSSLEKDLFHGTDPDTVEKICKENFDWRLYGKNATKYGQGSYFALNASYSDNYSNSAGHSSSQFMFLANVLVGSYVKGDSTMRRPPPKNPSDPTSDLYDSCVNNRDSPELFVVFEIDQCYPSYIIEYKAASQAYGAAVPRSRPVVTSASRNPTAAVARASSNYTSISVPAVPRSRPAVASASKNPTAAVARASSSSYTSTLVPASQISYASPHSGTHVRATTSLTSYTSSNTSSSSVTNRTSARTATSTGSVQRGYQTTKKKSDKCVIS